MDQIKNYFDEFLVSPKTQEFLLNTTNFREVGQHISSIFWSQWFWLPPHLTWEALRSDTNVRYADPTEIWIYPILMAFMIIALRAYVLNPFIARPLATYLGVKNKTKHPPVPNAIFEKVFDKYGTSVPDTVLASIARDSKASEEEIHRWLLRRKASHRPSKFIRFQEVVFFTLYHIGITILCAVTLYDRPWLYDISQCFENYPHHSIDDGIWWLYMTALAFYWSMIIWQLNNKRTKDTNMMILHHCCTIILISFSWVGGLFRMGALVLLTHEPTDIPLLMGKLGLYANLQTPTDILFGIFVVVWLITRVWLFPFWILRECFFYMPANAMSPAVYFQYCMGVLLLILNMLWTKMIFRILYNKLVSGDQLEDARSSEDVPDDEEIRGNKKRN